MICSEEDLPEQRILWEMNQWGVLAPWLHSWQRSQKHPRVVVGASGRKHPLFSVLFPSLCLSVQRQWSRHMRNSKAGWSCQAKGFIMIHFFPPTLAVNQQCCGVKIMMVTYKDEGLPGVMYPRPCQDRFQRPWWSGDGPPCRSRFQLPGYQVKQAQALRLCSWKYQRWQEEMEKAQISGTLRQLWSEAFEAWQLDRSWYRIVNHSHWSVYFLYPADWFLQFLCLHCVGDGCLSFVFVKSHEHSLGHT